LYNNEKSRLDARVKERTASVWVYFLSRKAEFINKEYDGGAIDDHAKGHERLIFPQLDKVRWWYEVFGRSDEDMNGPINTATERYLGNNSLSVDRGVLTGVETTTAAVGARTIRQVSNSNSGSFASLREGIAGLAIGKGKNAPGTKSPASVKQEMEVEMQ
jgi:hypothetical protein